MQATIQNVINFFSKVTGKVSQKITLHAALITMTSERKNYSSMARENNVPYDKIHIPKDEILLLLDECSRILPEKIKEHFKNTKKSGFLIIDFSMLPKAYAEYIAGLTYDLDGATKRTQKGFSAGFCFWSDGQVTLPLTFEFWFRQEDVGQDLYKKKTTLAIELITWAKNACLPFDEVRLDGAFATQEILKFLESQNIQFTMRIPRNRVITTANNPDEIQLSKHPELQLKRNQKHKAVAGYYKGVFAYFSTDKRKGKNGTREVVFIVSNVKRSPTEHVEAYKKRWPVEKFFRTAKQHLGLTHCQSTDINRQRFHIFSVMLSYALLEIARYYKKKTSVEEVLHSIRRQKSLLLMLENHDLELTFMC